MIDTCPHSGSSLFHKWKSHFHTPFLGHLMSSSGIDQPYLSGTRACDYSSEDRKMMLLISSLPWGPGVCRAHLLIRIYLWVGVQFVSPVVTCLTCLMSWWLPLSCAITTGGWASSLPKEKDLGEYLEDKHKRLKYTSFLTVCRRGKAKTFGPPLLGPEWPNCSAAQKGFHKKISFLLKCGNGPEADRTPGPA